MFDVGRSSSPLQSVPDADRIRDRLQELFAEVRFLRRLLRLVTDLRPERGPSRPAPFAEGGRR